MERLLTATFFCLCAAIALIVAGELSGISRLAPITVASAMCLLAVLNMFREVVHFRRAKRSKSAEAVSLPGTTKATAISYRNPPGLDSGDAEREDRQPTGADRVRDKGVFGELVGVVWLVYLTCLLLTMGMVVATPMFILPFLRLHGRESWLFSIAYAAGGYVVVEFAIVQLLSVPVYPGLIWSHL